MSEHIPEPLDSDFLNIILTMTAGTVTIKVQDAEDRLQSSSDSD